LKSLAQENLDPCLRSDDRITTVSQNADETRKWGERLAKNLKPGDIVALIGELGAGKTVLAQGILKGLGVKEPVQSPSFIMIREYNGRVPIVHIDLYRLRGSEDFEALGFEEYLDGQYVVVIEWGDKIVNLLPQHSHIIHITWGQDHNEQRKISVSKV
jgi:tRNA threonylcarbamoyladenosine biosynthesis protein TsaE